jgi:glucan biosynthesis protein|tara:strand:+ start:789 stop:1184 length:396 start_codon:yes stop_codon:yes gene_type:complete
VKKDIDIPEVENVYVAAVKVYNESFKVEEWNAYLINDRDEAIEMALIVSKGYDNKKETSVIRHKLEKLPSKSFAKIEFIQEEVLALNNQFQVTFFADGKMFEKKYLFRKNSVNEKALREIPIIPNKGVLAE